MPTTRTYTTGTTATLPTAIPYKANCKFKGWSLVQNDTTALPTTSNIAFGLKGTQTVYAIWESLRFPVTWAVGTDDEIVNMVNRADRGEIDLRSYWSVGEVRSTTYDGDTPVQLVLVAKDTGTYNSNNPCYHHPYPSAAKSGRQYPFFIVQQKDCLPETKSYDDAINICTTYKTLLPTIYSDIFKGNFFLPAAHNILNTRPNYVDAAEWNADVLWNYYSTSSNRIKKLGTKNDAEYFTHDKALIEKWSVYDSTNWYEYSDYYAVVPHCTARYYRYTFRYDNGSYYPDVQGNDYGYTSAGVAPAGII